MDADVLIVGAGPTGLTLGIDLARRGVRALLVERSERLFPGSRGKGLQPRTQEVFDDLGVLEAVRAAGGPYPSMLAWDGERRVKEWDIAERVAPSPNAPYTEGWMLPQWRTQEVLYARLVESGGSVAFGTELSGFTQDGDGVTAELTGGERRSVRAAYLVAADGGRSSVRRALGVGMTGETVDPEPMLVADVRLDGLDRGNWHIWPQQEGEGGSGVALCPLAGTDHFQLAARGGAALDTSPDGVRKLIATRTWLREEQVLEVLWASEYRARAALADRFRDGRVFLAGDAAHIHSPAGGQGLNTSVQDAYNLGWKLDRVLRHGAPDALLDTYEAERLPVAAGVLGISTRIHRAGMLTDRSDNAAARRGAETQQLGIGYRGGPLARELRRGLPDSALQAGDRAPDAPCTTPEGAPYRLFDAFRGPHWTLLSFGGTPLPRLTADAPVHAYRVGAPDAGTAADLLDTAGHARSAYAARGLFLIRPDGYVGLATDDPADVPEYLASLPLGLLPMS